MVSPPQRKKLKEYVNHFILLIIILTSVFLNGNPVEASSLESKNVLDNKIVSSTNVVTDTLSLLIQSEDFLSLDKDVVYVIEDVGDLTIMDDLSMFDCSYKKVRRKSSWDDRMVVVRHK